jgi:hypothetical protein
LAVREQVPVARPNLVREPLIRNQQLKSILLKVYFCLDSVITISKTVHPYVVSFLIVVVVVFVVAVVVVVVIIFFCMLLISSNTLQYPVLTWLGTNLFPECPLAEDEWNMYAIILALCRCH